MSKLSVKSKGRSVGKRKIQRSSSCMRHDMEYGWRGQEGQGVPRLGKGRSKKTGHVRWRAFVFS